jgi:hypothetical protein
MQLKNWSIKEDGISVLTDYNCNLDELNIAFPKHPVSNLYRRFISCGDWARHDYFCKQCKNMGNFGLVKTSYSQVFCEIRYCWNPDCCVHRFANVIEEFKRIKELHGYGKLWHFVIGFKSISLDEFTQNWSRLKKDYEYTLNALWSKLKKNGVVISALRALDFSFESDGMVFPHFHFAATIDKRGLHFLLKVVHETKKELLKKSKRCHSFNFKSFGYKCKNAMFAYLAKRSVGIYKHGEGKNLDWNTGKGRLKKDLIAGKYFGLNHFLGLDDYVKHFYKKRHYAVVGGLSRPQCSNSLRDSINSNYPCYCPFCQKELEEDDVQVISEFGVDPPPNENKNYVKYYNSEADYFSVKNKTFGKFSEAVKLGLDLRGVNL